MSGDEYGSVLREKMKESMSEPFTPLNRRKGDINRLTLAQGIVGTLAFICTVLVIAYQIAIHIQH